MLGNYSVTETNPNDATGGGGCLCSDTKVEGTTGPYVVFNAVETDFIGSPFPVLCSGCLCDAFNKAIGEEVVGELMDDDEIPEV
jgi:hypothetical protein